MLETITPRIIERHGRAAIEHDRRTEQARREREIARGNAWTCRRCTRLVGGQHDECPSCAAPPGRGPRE